MRGAEAGGPPPRRRRPRDPGPADGDRGRVRAGAPGRRRAARRARATSRRSCTRTTRSPGTRRPSRASPLAATRLRGGADDARLPVHAAARRRGDRASSSLIGLPAVAAGALTAGVHGGGPPGGRHDRHRRERPADGPPRPPRRPGPDPGATDATFRGLDDRLARPDARTTSRSSTAPPTVVDGTLDGRHGHRRRRPRRSRSTRSASRAAATPITATTTIPGAGGRGAHRRRDRGALGARPTDVTLAAPDRLTVERRGRGQGPLRRHDAGDLSCGSPTGPRRGQVVTLLGGERRTCRCSLTDATGHAGGRPASSPATSRSGLLGCAGDGPTRRPIWAPVPARR